MPLGTSAGSVEIGHGQGEYTPVVEGETFPVQLGLQGLWMFVVSARVTGMDIADGDTAAVWYTAMGPTGETISLDSGCRARGFAPADDGSLQMTDAYFVAIHPDFSSVLSGGTVTIAATVRDVSGHEATSSVAFISAMPMQVRRSENQVDDRVVRADDLHGLLLPRAVGQLELDRVVAR